jgi:protein-disulfide isomerase
MEAAVARLTLPVSRNRDHIQGSDTAPATLLEYGDYECPFCGQAHVIIKQLQEALGGNLQFVFRNFPLTQVHPHAQSAAEAAESAGAQNKFWEMHDYLYENQQALEDGDLMHYASILRLDLKGFVNDVTNHVHAPRIREDFLSGIKSGVNGTPAFYINGIRHNNSWDFETLFRTITNVIEEVVDKQKTPPRL